MQLTGDVVHALVVAQNPLGNGLADFTHKAFHIEVFEHATDDRVCEEVRRREREHESGRDVHDRLVKIRSILKMTSGSAYDRTPGRDSRNIH